MTQRFSAKSFFYNNPYLILLLVTALWGGNAVVGKLAVGHVSPWVLTFCRWLLADIVLLVIAWPHLKKDWRVLVSRPAYIISMAAMGFTGFLILLYSSLVFTSAVNVSIIQAGIPMMIFLLNFLVFRIRTLPMQIIGYSLTLLGVMIVVSQGHLERLLSMQFNIGDLMILVATVLYAAYSVGLKSKPKVHPLSLITGFALAALVIAVPFAAIETVYMDGKWPTSTEGFLVVAYVSIAAAVISQTLFLRGVELIGSNRAGIFINFLPVFGSLFAVIFVGESFGLYHLIALVLVVGGVMLAQLKGKNNKSAH
jgi:drug/metabolite transporter (DMT)-like permease